MMQPALFGKILCIAATLVLANGIIVFNEAKGQRRKHLAIDLGAEIVHKPGTTAYLYAVAAADKGDKAAVVVYNDGATAATAPNEWQRFFFVEVLYR